MHLDLVLLGEPIGANKIEERTLNADEFRGTLPGWRLKGRKLCSAQDKLFSKQTGEREEKHPDPTDKAKGLPPREEHPEHNGKKNPSGLRGKNCP